MKYVPVVVATVGGEAEAELGGLGGEGLCEAMTFCQLLYVLKLVVLLSSSILEMIVVVLQKNCGHISAP